MEAFRKDRLGGASKKVCLKLCKLLLHASADLFLVIDLCSRHLHFCRLFCFFDGSFYVLSYVVHDAIDHNRMRRE